MLQSSFHTLIVNICIVILFIFFFDEELLLKLNKKYDTVSSTNKLGDGNKKRGRLSKHIAFYYNPKNDPRNDHRLGALRRVLHVAETYTDYYNVDISLHTNLLTDGNVFDLNATLGYTCNLMQNMIQHCPNITVLTHDMSNTNPHFLTWKHREYMLKQNAGENEGYYDIFLYVEDDQLFTLDALQYFIEYSPMARSMGCRLGFLRVSDPVYTNGLVYIKAQSTWGSIVRFNNTNNKIATNNSTNRIEWAQLVGETNYWAGWIMDNNSPDFKAFSSSPEFLPSPSSVNKFKIREIAAWGWRIFKAFSSSPEFLPSPSSVNKFKIREIAATPINCGVILSQFLYHYYNLSRRSDFPHC